MVLRLNFILMRRNNKVVSVEGADNSPSVWMANSRETATNRELELLSSLAGKKRVEKTTYKQIGKKVFPRTVWVYE